MPLLNERFSGKGACCESIGRRTPDFALCHALAEYLREEKYDD